MELQNKNVPKGQVEVKSMCKLPYHAFKKPRKLKNGKKIYHWYYYYIDETGKQVQKACGPAVRKREDAETFIRSLPPPPAAAGVTALTGSGLPIKRAAIKNSPDVLVREIAEDMFLPGSLHVLRRQQLKKSITADALIKGRRLMEHIIKAWGDRPLRSLELNEIMNYLFLVERSGSWKNQYLSALKEIYIEAQFQGCKIYKPDFPSIGKVHKKADIFTEEELGKFFKKENFLHEFFYLFFLTALSGGLRLGEVRALRAKQIVFEKKAVIIDGFLKDDNSRTTYNKKGSPEHPKLRVVMYPDFTLGLLAGRIKSMDISADDYIFTYNDKPITKSFAERTFTLALIKAGIAWDKKALKEKGYWKAGHIQVKNDLIPDGRRLIPHSLRYTYITRMSQTMDAHSLGKFTGHDSTAMVDYYNRTNLDMALRAIPAAEDATAALLPSAIKTPM